MVDDLQQMPAAEKNQPMASTISNVHVKDTDPTQGVEQLQQLQQIRSLDANAAESSTISNVHIG